MTEEKPEESKPEKKQKLPINFMTNEFMDQQLTTLNKIKKGEKEDANDANANGGSAP